MPSGKYEFSTEDFEYVRHGDRALKLRVFRPRGDGPFPAVIVCTAAPGAMAT